jgi:ABC-type branched-subunit amino acid transport system substrate-binding protein
MMTRALPIVVALLASGCGSRSSVDRIDAPMRATEYERSMYRAGVDAFEAGRLGDAEGRFERLLQSAPKSAVAPHARLYLGRIIARSDAGLGADQLVALASSVPEGELRLAAELYGGIASMRAKRCITARRLLEPLVQHEDPRVVGRAAFGMAGCSNGVDALRYWALLADNEPKYAETALTRARSVLATLDVKTAAQAVDTFRSGPLATMVAENLARLARERNDPHLLQKAMEGLRGLRADGASSMVGGATRLGVILPLSGRSRPLGLGLRGNLESYYLVAAEDRPAHQPTLLVRDGGTPELAAKAVVELSEQGVFATVGVFDAKSSPAVAEAAESTGLPTVMLTLSDAPLTAEGPVWRAFHTPVLVARSAAGAAMGRGGRTAVVLRRDDNYGRVRGHWFRQAWLAGGGIDGGEEVWSSAAPDWNAIAKRLSARQFDTLFMPVDVNSAVQLLRHLASVGIWSRARTRNFKGERGVREVTIVGPAEWYHPRFARLGGRYAEGVIFPTPFAMETARGHAFVQKAGTTEKKRAPNAFDALLVDVIEALRRAHNRAESESLSPADAVRRTKFNGGASSGLDFAQRDALPSLFLLEVTGGTFRPVTR